MNYSRKNFRYRKIQKDVQIIKNQRIQSKQQIMKNQIKSQCVTHTINSYIGKKYTSIRSLVKRLQAVSNAKINYPHIKTRNQRTDIFLKGGSINNIKKIDYLQDSKKYIKNPLLHRRKTLTKFSNYDQDIEQPLIQMQQVFISKKARGHFQENNQSKLSNHGKGNLKTQTQKSMPMKPVSKEFQRRSSFNQDLLLNVQYHSLTQQNCNQNNKKEKYQKSDFQSLKSYNQLIQKRIQKQKMQKLQKFYQDKQKRNISTRQTSTMQINLSQNQIKSYAKQSKRLNILKTATNSNVQLKNQLKKKQIQIVDLTKPLFYFSQDQLRQLRLSAKNFIVTQYPSKQIITGSYFKQVAQIASLTKIITFYCCLLIIKKFQLDMDKQILIIDQQVQHTSGTSAELLEGDKYSFRQICYGLMLPSGNDAALAMAKWGGKIVKKEENQNNLKAFMTFMNATCNQIGMKNSSFGNPHGLPHAKSRSSVQDVSIVIMEALKFDFFRECKIENNGIIRQVVWQNTHKLLRRKGFIGVKTGVTVTAGPCLSTCYQVGGKIFTVVLLKTSKLSRRFKQTRRILGKVLSRLDFNLYKNSVKQILKNDAQLDSDNSEDQQQFNYERNDMQQMKKRMKILTYEM